MIATQRCGPPIAAMSDGLSNGRALDVRHSGHCSALARPEREMDTREIERLNPNIDKRCHTACDPTRKEIVDGALLVSKTTSCSYFARIRVHSVRALTSLCAKEPNGVEPRQGIPPTRMNVRSRPLRPMAPSAHSRHLATSGRYAKGLPCPHQLLHYFSRRNVVGPQPVAKAM